MSLCVRRGLPISRLALYGVLCTLLPFGSLCPWFGSNSPLGGPGLARAQPEARSSPIALRWQAPSACPSASEIVETAEALLAEALLAEAQLAETSLPEAPLGPERASRAPIEVEAIVSSLESGRFEVRLESAQGVRRLEASSCALLGEAVSLILALMVDPAALETAPEPEGAAALLARLEAEAEPELASGALAPDPGQVAEGRGQPAPFEPAEILSAPRLLAPPSTPPPPPAPRSGPDRWLGLQLHLLGDLGSLPAAALGPAASISLGLGRLRCALGAFWLAPREGVAPARPSAGGLLSLAGARLSAAFVARSGRLELGPAALLEAGVMVGEGHGVTDPGLGRALWFALGVGLEARLGLLPWLRLRAALELALPLLRPSFVLLGVGPVHRASPAIARVALGLELAYDFSTRISGPASTQGQ